MTKNKKLVLVLIGIALFIKLFLFVYMSIFAPQGRILPDSLDYLNNASMLASQGVFAQVKDSILQYEAYRTPGYAWFLCFFHNLLKIPLFGIVFLQILLSIGTAWIIYRAALEIDPRTAFLSGLIVLFSPPITTSALLILSDTLFVFLFSLFMLVFIRYLKSRKTGLAALSAVFLVLATYVRPVSYPLGVPVAMVILYVNFKQRAWRMAILQTGIFLLVTYGLLGLWQLRNYYHTQHFLFTDIQRDYKTFPNFTAYALQRFPPGPGKSVLFSYFNEAWHDFLSLMARPGTLKYLHSYSINVAGKIFGYPFVVLCWVGFLAGLARLRTNINYQFIFLLILYFIILTIGVIAASCGERYQVPIVPLFAMISAAGWVQIKDYFKAKQ